MISTVEIIKLAAEITKSYGLGQSKADPDYIFKSAFEVMLKAANDHSVLAG